MPTIVGRETPDQGEDVDTNVGGNRRQAAVAGGHEETVNAALAVLRAGGNAVDAALAAGFVACVVEPVLASPGGGGFATVRADGDGEAVFDFFAQTPRQRNEAGDDAFFEIEADFGETSQAFHIGLGASATPGFIPGMYGLWSRYGSMPMAELVAPAIGAARHGVRVNEYQAFLLGVVSPIYIHDALSRPIFGGSSPKGLLAAGETLRNPDLADVFDHLARAGLQTAIDGDLARCMAACSIDHGGHLTAADFEAYAVVVRDPLNVAFAGASLATNPPPSIGGVLIAFALGLIDGVGAEQLPCPSLDEWAAVFEITQKARRSITEHQPDALAGILDPETLAAFKRSLDDHPPAIRGTTHISVIDCDDMAIALTLSNGEGCGVVVPGCGFMLNNMLGEEDINPAGLGIWQTDRRMASMMAPSILTAANGSLTALGSGGSNRIRTAMTQVIASLARSETTLEEAVTSPRCHVEGETLFIEDFKGSGIDEAHVTRRTDIEDIKIFTSPSMFFGGVHGVRRLPDGEVEAFGDPRRAGHAGVLD